MNQIGDIIAILANSDEDWKEVNANADAFIASLGGGSAAPAAPAAEAPSTEAAPAAPASNEKALPIGPAVRLLLSSYGLSANQVTGTGPHGTVLKG